MAGNGQPRRMRRLDWPHHNQTDEEWLWLLSVGDNCKPKAIET